MSSKPRFVGEKVRLGDCFPYIKNGYNVRQGKDKGGMPITRIETLSDNRFNRDKVGYADIFSTEGLENHILEDGDILMSHINSLPYLGRSVMYRARPGEVFIHGMNLLRLKADRSVVEPGYAELYFRSPRFKQHVLKIAKKAVNQASFSVSDLKEIEFPLMSLCDQHDVIEKLSSVTTQIEHCQRAIGKLDSLVKSRFVEMFGDLSGYESRTLKECVSGIESGKSPKCLAKPREGNNPGVLKLSAISSGIYKETENKALPSDAKATDGRVVCDGDILLARKNTPELVGQSVFVNHTDGNIMFPDIVFRMHAKYEVDGVYLSYALAHPLAGAIKSLAHGSAKSMSNIPKSELVRLPIPLPPLALQREFATFVSQVDKSRFIAQQQIEKLQMLYDSLAQDYFGD